MTDYQGQVSGVQWTGTDENRIAAFLYGGGITLKDVNANVAGTVSGNYFFFGSGRNPPGKPLLLFPLGPVVNLPFTASLEEMSFPLPPIPGFSASDALSSIAFADDTRRTITADWSSPDGIYELHATLSISSPLFGIAPIALPIPPEGDAGTTTHFIDIIREGGLDAASVAWSVSGSGTHPADASDFAGGILPAGIASFAANQTTLPIAIPVAGGGTPEPDETYTIRLDIPADDLVVLSSSLTATISNDDGPPASSEVGAVIAGTPTPIAPTWCSGPVPGVDKEIILLGLGDIALTAYSPNWFIRTGDGTDAVAADTGTNVVDGGGGSNFLSGKGAETYFIDAQNLTAPVWSTVIGFEVRDAVTIWMDKAADAALYWVNDQGADGYRGLTLLIEQPSRPLALLTLPGFTTTDVGGRLRIDRGISSNDIPYLYLHTDSR